MKKSIYAEIKSNSTNDSIYKSKYEIYNDLYPRIKDLYQKPNKLKNGGCANEKGILATIISLVLIFSLVACNSSKPSDTNAGGEEVDSGSKVSMTLSILTQKVLL